MSVATQSVVHEDGNVPSVVDNLTVAPPVDTVLPFASSAWTVIVVVLDPFAVIEDGVAEIVDVDAEIGPGV